MDFHNLKRRGLQALCKKHKIPANLTNLEMAEKLTALLTVNEKPLTRGRRSCLKGLDENVSENEFDVENRQAKKVRFGPENEMIDFEKSEVRYLGIRCRGSRKSVMFMDKGSGGVVTTGKDGVNEEVRELRRSRRGKPLEGSDVHSKRGKRATEVDALRDNSIADDMANGEVREIRRSRRGKLSEVSEVESGGEKAKQLNVLEDKDIADNGEVREVRRSTRGKSSEGSEAEIKGEQRVTKVVALDHNGIVDYVPDGKVREVRRSRRGKLTEGSDALKDNLPSAADHVPSLNLQNKEHIVGKKRFLSKRTVYEEKRENEDAKKGSREGNSVKNLRSGKEEDHEDVDGSKEAVTESACVHFEAVVRRSKRHVAKVDYVQHVNEKTRKNENVSHGMVVVKEGALGGGNLRRSQRNASKPECSTSKQGSDVLTIVNNEKGAKKQRRDAVLEGEVAMVDGGNTNDRSFRQIKRNTKRSRRVVPTAKREKVTQKERDRSKKTNIEVEDSFTKDIPTTTADHDAKPSSSEAPEDTICNNDELSANAPESTVPAELKFLREGQASGTSFGSTHSPITENAVQIQGETFTYVERNEGNDSKTTLCIRKPLTAEDNSLPLQNYCVDRNLEYVYVKLDKQHGVMAENMSFEGHPVSPCEVIEEKPKLESFNGKEREQLDLKEHNSSEPENPLTLLDVYEGATLDVDNDCDSEAIQTTLINADETKQEELTNAKHSTNTLKQREELTTMQKNGCGPHRLSAAATNFDHPELSSFKDPKSDDNGDSKIECDNSEELLEPKSPGAFRRSATRILLDGDVNCEKDIIYWSDMQGELLVSTPPSAKSVETATEFSGSICVSKRVESPKSTFTLEVDGKPLKTLVLETHLEMSTQSPSERIRGVEVDLYQDGHLAESSKHKGVGQLNPLNDRLDNSLGSPELNSSVRTKFNAMQDKDGPDNEDSIAISDCPDHSLQSHELNSSARTKFSVIQDQDLPDDGDSIAASDVLGVVLSLSGADTQIAGGKCTEIELSSSKSCSRGSSATKSSPLLEHQTAGANTESNHSLLMDDNMPNQGYGDCSEVKMEEESISVEALFMIKSPSTSEDAGIEKCTMSIDKSVKGVVDIFEDQPELITEVMEKGIHDCIEMHEAYVGKEDEPANLEKWNSNQLKSPHGAPDVAITDKTDGCISVSVDGPLKNTDENYQDFIEDPDVAYGSKLSSSPGTNIQKKGAFTDFVESEKHSEQRTHSSTQRNCVDEYFMTETDKNSEERQILQEVAESEEAGNLMDQHNRFDDGLMRDKLNSSVRSKIQEQGISDNNTVEIAESCGVISSPTNVATQIIGGRCTEIELSARKSSSMSSSPLSIFKFQSVGTESKHCLSADTNAQNQGHEPHFEGGSKEETHTAQTSSIIKTPSTSEDNNVDDNAQNQGHEVCFEGGSKDGTDSVRALSIIQTPSTSKDDGLEISDMLIDGRSSVVIEAVKNELGSLSKGMEPKRNCLSDWEAAIERETQETENGEGEPLNWVTSNTVEAETVRCAIEVATIATVDGCPSNATYSALKNSNENEQVEISEVSFTEPVSIPNPMVEEKTSNHENEMEPAMTSISTGRVEDSCKFDEKSTKEEQEKKVSGHADSLDAEEDDKWRITHQNICTNAFEETNEDEPKVQFRISITSHENDAVRAPDNGALHNPISQVASAEETDCSVLQEHGTLLQHDEQKIDDFKFQGEIDIGKEDEHVESGAEINMLSLEIKIPPSESKGDDIFSFDHTKDAEEIAETSLAMLFQTQVDTPWMNPKDMADSESLDPAVSESTISKDQLFKESEVFDTMIDNADAEPWETLSPSTKNPSSTLQSYLSTELAELVQLVEPEAVGVEKLDGAGVINNPLNKELDQGKATVLIKTEAVSISGTSDHQCAANAVAACEHNLVSNLKTDSTQNKDLGTVADDQRASNADRGAAVSENVGSAAKYTPNRRNARTILIHGTPNNKLRRDAHMKENATSSKSGKVGTLTSVKPVAQRPPASKHLPWK